MTTPRNITEMTEKKHSFDGFSIRLSRNGYRFIQYVSSAKRPRYSEAVAGTARDRRQAALEDAVERLAALKEVVDNARSWRKGELTKSALNTISEFGFNTYQKETISA
jgi:hypothetical protein